MKQKVIDVISDIGALFLFGITTTRAALTNGIRFFDFVEQMYLVGVRSLPITLFAGLFVGGIMAIQINLQLRDFGAQGFLGGLSTSTTIRDIGPVLIAFLLSGKVGAYTSAELGTMRVTNQIDALRCLGTDPIVYLIAPRLCAVVCSSFLLLIVGLTVTVLGGIAMASWSLGINVENYVANIARIVSPWSVMMGVVKSFIFGSLIGLICCYRGYHTSGGAIGVGRSVKRAAVDALLSIIVMNFILSTMAASVYEWLGVDRL